MNMEYVGALWDPVSRNVTQRAQVPNIFGLWSQKTMPLMVFGIRVLKDWVLGPSGLGFMSFGPFGYCSQIPHTLGLLHSRKLRQAGLSLRIQVYNSACFGASSM